jgi:hypothetical protein
MAVRIPLDEIGVGETPAGSELLLLGLGQEQPQIGDG